MQISEIFLLFQIFFVIFVPICSKSSEQPVKSKHRKKKKAHKKVDSKIEETPKQEEKTQKDFPEFVMPSPSVKNQKLKEVQEDKIKKIKEGFFQEKSDQDDTLEKIESLKVEQSDRTKRAAKKKK